jgi:hypothetical protein
MPRKRPGRIADPYGTALLKLFVVGAPRSGTTVMGNFIGSHPQCCDLGEYYGFFLSFDQAPHLMARMPSPVKEQYLRSLVSATVECAESLRREANAVFWCDQTPWNLLVAETIAKELPDAVFLLMLRHYRGVVMSLRRSFAAGYQWAGWQIQESAKLWAQFYAGVDALPMDRTIVVSYDRLCEDPEPVIRGIETSLAERLGAPADGFDRTVFAQSHATSSTRRTLAHIVDNEVKFRSIPSYETSLWTDGMEAASYEHVARVHDDLCERFGNQYASLETTPC